MIQPLLFVLLLMTFFPGFSQSARIRVATFNIRYNNPDDGINAWPNRKEMVKGLIDFHAIDILGVQEALHEQITELEKISRFARVGVGRDDGRTAGEYSAVFYDKNRFRVQDNGTFWLSETPEKPSKGWDAAIVRICTWVKLRDEQTGKTFFVFNTHYDHRGEEARRQSSGLLLAQIRKIAGQSPVLLTGDFNSEPSTEAIRILLTGLSDAKNKSEQPPYGPSGTFNNFDWNRKLEQPIDYIFVSAGVQVRKYGVLSDNREQRYPSDHLPVLAEVEL